VIELHANNRAIFTLSANEYVRLTTAALRYNLDWMPVADNGFVSGEPPEQQRVAQRLRKSISRFSTPDFIRPRVLRRLINTLRNDEGKPMADDSSSLTIERLNELDGWLAGAKQVCLLRSHAPPTG